MNPTFVDTRAISLKEGQVLEVQMTQEFVERLRQYFGLLESQAVDDSCVRYYLLESVKVAVTKAERELDDGSRPAEGIR